MTKYIVTIIIPFTMELEANTEEHAMTKALLVIEEHPILIKPDGTGRPSLAKVTEVRRVDDDEQ